MPLVNLNYKFLYVNVEAEGSGSDGGAFRDTSLFKAIKNDRSWSEADTPPEETQPMPYCFVTDDAITIRKWLLNMIKPSPHRNMTRRNITYRF